MMYNKSVDFVETIYNVSNMINKSAIESQNKRFMIISSIILCYFNKIAKETNCDLSTLNRCDHINLVPFFEYVSKNNIEFYDFKNVSLEDFDQNNENDFEKYVLSHIYYITQK